jgi:hypothetical protein
MDVPALVRLIPALELPTASLYGNCLKILFFLRDR